MTRTWSEPGASPNGAELDIETEAARASERTADRLCALYVTGPKGGCRHVLPDGFVRLGRGSECGIVVDDPRVSRSHAALHVTENVMLTDLGSANGTKLGNERLGPGEVRPLAVGQTFFIGDSALVVRVTSLRRTCPRRVTTFEQVHDRLVDLYAARVDGPRVVVIKVRPMRPTQSMILEAVLDELLESRHDWLLFTSSEQVLVGVTANSDTHASRWERRTLEQLVSWGQVADVEARVLSQQQIASNTEDLASLICSDEPLSLKRGKIVIRDPAMASLRHSIARVAPAPICVLFLGETGAGKDVAASILHELSPRADKPFVGLNCANLPESLLESELFGHERGSFTGAVASKPGLMETADGGTVFLDEVGDLALPLQAKLLRVMESREVTRLGGLRSRTIDVRFVAATNRDLEQEVAKGTFRKDFYYRINCVTLVVPPLRQRSLDIEALAHLFLESACARFQSPPLTFAAETLAALNSYSWPGNVRELSNVVERAVLMAPKHVIEPAHLGLTLAPPGLLPSDCVVQQTSVPQPVTAWPQGTPEESDSQRIARALIECGGNQTRAAKVLGIPRRTLVRRLALLGLPRPRRSS